MAQGTVGALRVILGVDSAAFEKGITAAQKQVRRFERSVAQMGKRVRNVGIGMSASITAPVVAFGRRAYEAGVLHREAMGQVEAGLRSMGDASGKTSKQLKASALELESMSTFNADDVLKKVTANMLTFGNVSGEVFDRAQMAAVNLSVRLDQDLKSSAIQVGKALNDPVLGISALSRVGIQFAEDQKAMIKAMVEAGDVAGAQGIILAELERQYDGSALAARNAAPDSEMIDNWRKLKRTVGEIILNVLPPLTDMLSKIAAKFNSLTEEQQKNVVKWTAIAAAAGPVLIVLGSLVTALAPAIAALKAMYIATAALTAPGSLAALKVGIAALASPLGIVIALLIGAGGLVYAYKKWTQSIEANRRAGTELQKIIDKTNQLQEQSTTTTKEAAKANLENAMALREETRAQIEKQKALVQSRIEQAKASMREAGPRGEAVTRGALRQLEQAERDLKELNKQYAAQTFAMVEAEAQILKFEQAEKAKSATVSASTEVTKSTTQANDEYAVSLDRAAESLRRKVDASNQAHLAYELELGDTLLLAAAWQKGAREAEIVTEQIRIMRTEMNVTASEAREMAEELVSAREAMDEAKDGSNALTAAQKRLQDALKETSDKSEEAGEKSKTAFEDAADGFTSFLNALKSGDPVAIIEEIIKALIRLQAARKAAQEADDGDSGASIFSLFGGKKDAGSSLGESSGSLGDGLSSIFGGFRAKGGPVTAGKAYVVGEQGPEMFLPGRNGSIVPNGGMQAAQVMIVPTPYFDAKVQGEAAKVSRPIAMQESQFAIASQRKTAAFRQDKRL